MNKSKILRRSFIGALAAMYYAGVVYLTGLSTQLTSMSQFFGHALIYAGAVGLISSLLFIVERSSSKKKEEELCAEILTQSQRNEKTA